MTILSPEDIVDSVRHDPDYGYQGRVNGIRREEYANLGGAIPRVMKHCVNLFSE
jgi:hypothetical protein